MPSHQEWVLKAKAEGYPTCRYCGEPLPKSVWKKGYHWFCHQTELQLKERIRQDEWVERNKRYDGEE